jgi:membrane fusion protein (multidrug efflux system)
VSLRAVVPNPQHSLLPGMFVKLRLTLGQLPHAYLLPQATVARDSQGAYVMVVDASGKVSQQRITTHGMTRDSWIATGELKDGDQIIIEGLQKVRPGAMAKAVIQGEQAAGAAPSAKPAKP